MDVPAMTMPKKQRRRRAAANSGAADDCFTCQSKNSKCDRRRPYCQQCLDLGKDCGGYKQALTWGMGIASRGKMRGLSSPAAQRPTSNSDRNPRLRPSKKVSVVRSPKVSGDNTHSQSPNALEAPSLDMSGSVLPTHTSDWCLPLSPQEDWGHISELGKSYEVDHPSLVVGRLQTPYKYPSHDGRSDHSFSIGAASLDSDQDWPSPSEASHFTDDSGYLHQPWHMFNGLQHQSFGSESHEKGSPIQRAPASCPDQFSSAGCMSDGSNSEESIPGAIMLGNVGQDLFCDTYNQNSGHGPYGLGFSLIQPSFEHYMPSFK